METQELSTTSILALFETNKGQRQSFVQSLVQSIEEGNISPLVIHTQVKAMEDIIFQLTSTDEKKNKSVESAKRYRAMLLDEAGKYGKTFDFHNGKFETKEVGTKYDYSVCEDPEINALLIQEQTLKEKIKQREKFLQNIPESGFPTFDEITGEATTIYRPSKTSTTALAVTLK